MLPAILLVFMQLRLKSGEEWLKSGERVAEEW